MTDAVIGLIGNPNCGKSTLFNQLTGTKQKVGNWPGVTVEKKEGQFSINEKKYTLVDLPGTYALDSQDNSVSTDEKIARDYALSGNTDLIINILDASNLERNLFLTSQLIDIGIPIICAVNMLDVATREGIHLDIQKFSAQLGIKVVPIIASTGKGLDELKEAITQELEHPSISVPAWQGIEEDVNEAIESLINSLSNPVANPRWTASRAIEGDRYAYDYVNSDEKSAFVRLAETLRAKLETDKSQPIDILIADSRYRAIRKILNTVVNERPAHKTLTEKIDQWLLNRWLGIPFFFFTMYLMFIFAINVGGAFIDFFDIASNAVFVEGTRSVLNNLSAPEWISTLLADGIGGGIQLVATFIPIIAALYLFLSVVEDSGYMARAAFVMDRLMRTVGLPGKSFVPLIVGFGCNVPAVMAARTMDTQKDRLLTIAMAPFMSCGARLSVFALFAAAFFADQGALMVFSLYVFGILVAMATGFALKHTLFTPDLTPFVMELPAYHIPTVKGVLIKTSEKLRNFVLRAGKAIVIVVTILSFLNSIGTDGSFGNENRDSSVLSEIARVATPVLAPMGIAENNWPATVGVITGIFAKEAVVGTLDALYSQDGGEDEDSSLTEALAEAFATIPDNLMALGDSLLDPLGLSLVGADQTEEQGVRASTFTSMETLFGSQLAAFSYLVFILLYTPCVATLGAMVKEAGTRWMLFVAGWSTGLAYTCGVLVYQIGSWTAHPLSSSFWIAGCVGFIGLGLVAMRLYGQRRDAALIPLTPVS